MGERAGIGADWLDAWGVLRDRTAGRSQSGLGFSCRDRSRAGGGTAEAARVGMAEAATGRLDVSAGPLATRVGSVVRQGVQARQAGSCRQEHQEQEESLGLDQSRDHGISIAAKT